MSEITHRIATPSTEIFLTLTLKWVSLKNSRKQKSCLPAFFCRNSQLRGRINKKQKNNSHINKQGRGREEEDHMGAAYERLKPQT